MNDHRFIIDKFEKAMKFTFVGGLVALIDPSLLFLFHEKAMIGLNTSITMAYFISVVIHFTLSNTFTFSKSKGKLNQKLFRYAVQVLICYGLTLIIINLLLKLWLDNIVIAKLIAMSVCTVVSFFLMNYYVFPEGVKENEENIQMRTHKNKWPKQYPELTSEQTRIKDEWMKYWHEVLPKKYGAIEKFNHGYPVQSFQWDSVERKCRTLEIGAGLGEHILYEDLSCQEYYALELRENMAGVIKEKFSDINVITADCQERLPFDNNELDRIIAIHVLEHLPDMPRALKEIHRTLSPDGIFQVVIPCEGGLAYSFCRKISAERIFKKHFHMDYEWLIKTEHINLPEEMLAEIGKLFYIEKRTFFPLLVPVVDMNVVIGMVLKPKK